MSATNPVRAPGVPREAGPTRILVGYTPGDRGDDALVLASLFAKATGAPLTVAHVYPPPWPAHGPGRVDAEWVAFLKGQAKDALARAVERLDELSIPRSAVTGRDHPHRGSGRGLAEVAAEDRADLIVIGSAPRGRRGRIAVGSTADQLLHGSPVPVALAPRGFVADAPGRFERMTIAYRHRRGGEGQLRAAAGFAAALGVPVRLVTLVLSPPGLAARFRAAGRALEQQVAQADEDLRAAAGLLGDGTGVERLTSVGTSVDKALGAVAMPPGEVLACQSGHGGPLRKVFLGESSGKIVRAAPCPVLMLPRGAGPRAPAGR